MLVCNCYSCITTCISGKIGVLYLTVVAKCTRLDGKGGIAQEESSAMADHGNHTDHTGEQVGNYRLIRLLGRGGFADVYLGEHIYLKTHAAIKMLQTRLASTDMEDFLREARMIANLKHPHIVRVIDFGVENGIPFLVMDYAPNGTLRDHHPKGSRLPLLGIAQYVLEVGSALQYAHDHKLIHRDVKPENMLVGSDFHVMLSDFGIAIATQSSRYESAHEVVGTAAYMAPEQLQGKPMPASDQYSLAIIVYEWICGERPFRGSFVELYGQQIFMPPQPLHEIMPTISPDVEEVVFKALSKEPGQRFAKVISFANAFLQACDPTQIQVPFRQIASSPSLPIVTAIPPTLPLPQSQSSPSLPNVTPHNPITPLPPIHQSQSMPSIPKVAPVNPITPLPPLAQPDEMRPFPLEEATYLTPRSLDDEVTYLTPASFEADATYLTPKPFNSGSTEREAFAAPLPQPTPSPFPAMAPPLAIQAISAGVPSRRQNISRRTFVMSMAGLVAVTLVGGSIALLAGRNGPGPASPTTPTPSNPPKATVAPTNTPAPSATAQPTATPTTQPTATPTTQPTAAPTPSPIPTPDPTPIPTPDPTPIPTPDPTPIPTPDPTPIPTPDPTPIPTPDPTPIPTPDPTPIPTAPPNPSPTSLETGGFTFGFRS
jgi:serine/threonine protein kinase